MQRETGKNKFLDILMWPASCLLQISPVAALIGIIILAMTAFFIYMRVNFNFWGLAAIDYSEIEFSEDLKSIKNTQDEWLVLYETAKLVEFNGKIRHISPIRLRDFQILSHDVFVTKGDFENPEIVKVSVANHMFTWRTIQGKRPGGSINLLHTVPLNQEIYDQLWALNQDDQVEIRGYEILRINLVDEDGTVQRWWEDKGCNTILVTSIQTKNNP